MADAMRRSGIDVVGDVPWGTHLCQFYKTKEDLLDLLVPYFKAGLEGGDFCMWVTSDPLSVEDAEAVLRREVPGFDRMAENGQMEVVPYTEWYMKDGYFDMRRVFDGWIGKLEIALGRGFEGLRATGNTAWLEDEGWESFTEYEEELNEIIGDYPMMAVCTYSLDKCGASEVIDVVKNHQFALVQREGEWNLIEGSERRKAREALRKSEERFSMVVDNIQDAVVTSDYEFNITGWNHAAEEIYGWKAEEVLGSFALDVMQAEFLEMPYDEAIRCMREDGFFWGPLRQYHRDGTPVEIESLILGSRAPDGNLVGFIAVNRDVTARKRAEEALQKMSEELVSVNRELDGYARAVSHDLRGPLTAALLANALLEDSMSDDDLENLRSEVEDATVVIKRNIDKCHVLVNDLLTLAEAGQEPVMVSDVELSDLIGEILSVQQSELKERGFKVLVDDGLGIVRSNETQMYQLFSNLMVNSLRHNGSPNPVLVIRRLPGSREGWHRFLVRDNGPGIPEGHAEDSFRAFFKWGEGSDTGIGLSIVKKIVEAYGGEIKAYNDCGACFEFEIQDA